MQAAFRRTSTGIVRTAKHPAPLQVHFFFPSLHYTITRLLWYSTCANSTVLPSPTNCRHPTHLSPSATLLHYESTVVRNKRRARSSAPRACARLKALLRLYSGSIKACLYDMCVYAARRERARGVRLYQGSIKAPLRHKYMMCVFVRSAPRAG
jgi:hypothetical protein